MFFFRLIIGIVAQGQAIETDILFLLLVQCLSLAQKPKKQKKIAVKSAYQGLIKKQWLIAPNFNTS